jgi:tetratricopeptide (TPR) repeat protein
MKIEESPKSGELWCEGGRIYMELKEYSNAKKCFLAAIHFTPQYGDSFFELLKVLLIENRFLEIHQLRKVTCCLRRTSSSLSPSTVTYFPT